MKRRHDRTRKGPIIHQPSRRRFLGYGLTAGAMLASGLPLRSGNAAEIESILQVMGWGEYINPENINEWEETTGARFVYDAYASNDEMLSKLQLAGDASGYDIGMNTDFMIPLLRNRKLIQRIDKSRIPNIKHIDPRFLGREFDPDNEFTLPKNWGSQGFVYDANVITRPMETWEDFLEAIKNEASGRVSLLDDALAIAPLFWKDDISWNTRDEAVLDRVEKEVTELAPHIKMFNSYPIQDVANGTVALAQSWNGYARMAIQASDIDSLKFVFGSPKTELWLDNWHMPAGGPHPNAAYSWLNFILDPTNAAQELEYIGFPVPVSGLTEHLPNELKNDPLIFPDAETVARGERTKRNETYDRRVEIYTRFKTAAAVG